MKIDKKKIVYIVLACIIIIGSIIIGFKGLNVGLKYKANKQVDIYIGKGFNSNDIKTLVKEVIGNKEVIVQKVEAYEEIASITVEEITDEQLEELNTKVNEKYELENTVKDDMVVVESPRLRLRDLVKQFILPVALSLVIILVYAGIRFRKIDVFEVLGKILILNILAQMLYLSILAIFRIPVNALTVPIAIAIYVVVTLVIFNELETKEKENEQLAKNKK